MIEGNLKQKLIIYRNFGASELVETFLKKDISKALTILLEFASEYGFSGNLIHLYFTFHILNDDNVYARECERRESINTDLESLVLEDFTILRELLFVKEYEAILGYLYNSIKDYKMYTYGKAGFDMGVIREIERLAKRLGNTKNEVEFKNEIKAFYKNFGYGKFAFSRAFTLRENLEKADIVPISNVDKIVFSDIVGLEFQKNELINNTEAFLAGKPANNVLLFGDAGTGKSSSIKALLNELASEGLRIIEVYKHQFRFLPSILEEIKDRNYKFIIYMDDLSFEDNEVEYKHLKAILEGGLAARPGNVLIYATSNRRHLIRESFKDKNDIDEELHRRDTVQEKISLSARFGLNIYFSSPDKKEYDIIIKELARKADVNIEESKLLALANIWEMQRGGRSGRSACQFINSLQVKAYEDV